VSRVHRKQRVAWLRVALATGFGFAFGCGPELDGPPTYREAGDACYYWCTTEAACIEETISDGFQICVGECLVTHRDSQGWTDPPSACNLAGFEATLCKKDLDCEGVLRLHAGARTECSDLIEEQKAECE